MRLIRQYDDILQAENAAVKLRSLGILTHISAKSSYRISRTISGALRVGLWAVLDFQHEDAHAVLTKPGHMVTTALREEELIKIESQANETSVTFFNGILAKTGFIFIIFAGILLYLYSTSS